MQLEKFLTKAKLYCEIAGICLATLVVVLMLTACGKNITKPAEVPEPDPNDPFGYHVIIMPDPWVEHETIEAGKEAVSFNVVVPQMPEGYEFSHCKTLDDSVIEIEYAKQDEENSDQYYFICMRKGVVDRDDISGDYTPYEVEMDAKFDSCTVHVKGDGIYIYNATWKRGGASYSLVTNDGMLPTDFAETFLGISV